MAASSPCPYRYIFKGRTFCAIAIRERRYTTSEVTPSACSTCKAREVAEQVRCRHLDLGVEVDQYGGSQDVGVFYASCQRLMERLTDFGNCGEGKCPHWSVVEEERLEQMRQEALAAQREKERQQED